MLGAGTLEDKKDSSAKQGPDRFLGFGVRMRLARALAWGTSGPCLTSAALPICRDDLGEGTRKMKQGLVFLFT